MISKSSINRAGKLLVSEGANSLERDEALRLVNQWRTLHFYPVNTFQATLRRRIKMLKISSDLVSQRLKRSKSIIAKLERYPLMKLSTMQDIGGLRVVLSDNEDVYKLFNYYLRTPLKHELISQDDYIENPKSSGYRSIHLIYKFYKPDLSDYHGLQIEIQLRSKLQHIWATTVETAGTFLKTSLKSSQGPEEWLDFFKLISSIFALKEKKPTLEEHRNLNSNQLIKVASEISRKLKVVPLLSAFNVSADAIHEGRYKGYYHLIEIDLKERLVRIKSFKKDQLQEASDLYLELEAKSQQQPTEVVLVSAGSIRGLKKAYPSYFLDTSDFIDKLIKIEKAGLRR